MLTPLEKVLPLTVKNNQFPFATQAGFRVMETVMLRNTDDLSLVENKLAFPVIVRPISNNLREELQMKTALYENMDAMRKHLAPILAGGNVELIAQGYVPGTDRDIVFFMASCDETGEPRLWLAGRKIRQNPPGRGVMAAGQVDSVPDPEFVEKSKKLCRLFGLRGVIGIECKQHAVTKEYVYIESSFRPEAFNSIGLAAGVDLVWDAYLAALHKPCGAVRPETSRGSWSYGELEHGTMKLLRKQGDPDWWKVLLPLPRPIAYAIFTWDDPLPFFHSATVLLWRKIKKCFPFGREK
jgi:predicted ATP-grasp superfamily ATP-dependent carboligase